MTLPELLTEGTISLKKDGPDYVVQIRHSQIEVAVKLFESLEQMVAYHTAPPGTFVSTDQEPPF